MAKSKAQEVKRPDTRKPIFSVTLADCEVQTKRGSGKGGQNRNKRDTAVRIVHVPSGAVGESSEQRNQLQNKKTAFRRMAETQKFQIWINKMAGLDLIRESPEQQVEKMMRPENLKVEAKRGREWVTFKDGEKGTTEAL